MSLGVPTALGKVAWFDGVPCLSTIAITPVDCGNCGKRIPPLTTCWRESKLAATLLYLKPSLRRRGEGRSFDDECMQAAEAFAAMED